MPVLPTALLKLSSKGLQDKGSKWAKHHFCKAQQMIRSGAWDSPSGVAAALASGSLLGPWFQIVKLTVNSELREPGPHPLVE